MAKGKHYRKGDNQDLPTKVILLVTAVTNLIAVLIDLIKKLLG